MPGLDSGIFCKWNELKKMAGSCPAMTNWGVFRRELAALDRAAFQELRQ
jgi:hypothetical protein